MLSFACPFQCYAHGITHCMIACWDFAKTWTEYGVPNLEKYKCREISRASSVLGCLSKNKSFWLSTVLILPHDPSQSCDSMPLEHGHREYILSAWIQGLRGQRKDGHSSKMLLEMGILSSLHPAPSLKRGFSPKHQPFSSFNLEEIKLLWFLNLTKFIIICKLCREKVGRHCVPMIIFKIVWFKITHCSSQHMLCAGSKP